MTALPIRQALCKTDNGCRGISIRISCNYTVVQSHSDFQCASQEICASNQRFTSISHARFLHQLAFWVFNATATCETACIKEYVEEFLMREATSLWSLEFRELAREHCGKLRVKINELFGNGQALLAEGREDWIRLVCRLWRQPIDGMYKLP